MRVVITGSSGFLGSLLAEALLTRPVRIGGAPAADIEELVLIDLVEPRAGLAETTRVRALVGELDSAVLDAVGPADAILHLAGVVSGQAERDFDLGIRTNITGTRAVLEWARRQQGKPVVVFTSSLAVFGNDPARSPLGKVDDDTLPTPQSSYGYQKLISELLVADYARKGYLDGRSVRLMTVAVRPGAPNAAASGFISSIIREPLDGLPAHCPVDPDMRFALSSPARTIEGIVAALEQDATVWGSLTAMNLPSLTTTPAEMLAALDRTAPGASALVRWERDPAVEGIVETWPSRFDTPRAAALGLQGPEAAGDLIVEYLATRLARAQS